MPDLDQIIVKVTADVAQFKAQMASADASLDQFGASAKAAGAAGAGVGTTAGGAATQFERYAAALKNSYGINDSLTKSQVGVIRNLEAQVAATKLSGAELAAYTALRKAGTTADTEAGKIIAGLATAQYNLANGISETAKPAGVFASIMGSLFPSLNSNTAAAKELEHAHGALSAAHGRGGEAAKTFREVLHASDPALKEAGASIGALGGFASAARGGIVVLAGALSGALVVGLAEAGDKSDVLKRRLDALFGGSTGGEAAFKAIEGVADKTGLSIDAVAGAYEKLKLAQQSAATAGGISWLPGVGAPGFAGGDPSATIIKIVDALKRGGAAGKEMADGLKLATDAMAKGLDLATFEKIREVSPELGNAIAAAFGQPNVAAFEANLAKTAKTALETQRALATIKDTGPGIETTAQAFDGLWTSIGKVWEKLGESSQVKGPLSSFLGDLRQELDDVAKAGNPLGKMLDDLDKRLGKDAAEGLQGIVDTVTAPLKAAGNAPATAANPAAGSEFPAATSGLGDLNKALAPVGPEAGAAAGGLGSLGGAFATFISNIAAAIGQAEAASGGGAGGSGSGGDIQAPVADVGANAAGGIYKIGGAGAPDSIALSGMVTPGETVAVIPPDRTTPALLSVLKHAIGTSPIDAAPLDSKVLANVAAAVNGGAFGATPQQQQQALAKAVLLEQAKLAAGSSLLGGGQVLGSQLASRGGGARLGGIKQGAPSPWKDLNAPTYGAQPKDPTSGYGTGYAGSGGIYPKGSIYPSGGIYPTGRGGGSSTQNTRDATGLPMDATGGGNTGNYGYQPQDGFGNGSADPYSFDPGSPYSFDPGAFDHGGGSGDSSPGAFDTSYSDPYYGGDYGDGGDAGDYYGAYAKGGRFKVPGVGATDSKRIKMDVTPGEHVTVTPPGQNADQRPLVQHIYLSGAQLNNPSSRRQLERMGRNMAGIP